MRKLNRVAGRAYPDGRANIDTDQVIASRWLKTISREGLGRHLFEDLRRNGDSIYDDPAYAGAPILIAGENFGCGSSREHAAWTLLDFGIRVVIAPTFSDIFTGNAFRNGILTVVLPAANVERLLTIARTQEIAVDLEARTVTAGGETIAFPIDDFRRRCLLEGLDEIALTLADQDEIAAHEIRARADTPWLAAPQFEKTRFSHG